jgi:O-antigen/teichoic acid export membrane protein
MKQKTKIFSNSIYLLADFVVITIISFTFWLILGRLLTPAETGIIFTSWGIATILSAISLFGLGSAITKLISENESDSARRNLIQISFKYVIISNLIIFVAIIFLNQYFTSLLHFTFLITLFTALNIFILSVNSITGSILNGVQEMKKIFKTDFIGYSFKVIVVISLIFLGLSSLGALATLAGAFFLIFLLRVKSSWFSFKSDSKAQSALFHYAFPSFISSIAAIVFSNIQYIILTAVKNPAATGIFGYAILVTAPLNLIPITFGSALFPIISRLSTRKSNQTQSYLLNLVVRYSLLIVLPAAVFLAYFSKQFFTIFFPNYLSATSTFPYLIPGSIFFGISAIFNASIYALREPKLSRNITVFVTILFVILSIPLTQMLSTNGLAMSYFIANLVMLILTYFYIKKLIHFKLKTASFLKLFFATILFLGFLISSDFLATSLAIKILLILAGLSIYVAILFLMKFYIKEDIQVVRAMLRRLPFMQKHLMNLIDYVEKRL